MANLTDCIEEYLKKLLALSSGQYIEVRRRELAGKFKCVPSQINYVLERRFTMERGFLVESRRGGGGCIRIYRIKPDHARPWREVIEDLCREEFDPVKARETLKRMCDEKVISVREARLLEAIIGDRAYELSEIEPEKTRKLQKLLLGAALEELLKVGY